MKISTLAIIALGGSVASSSDVYRYHPEWATQFCECLQGLDDPALSTARDCIILRSDTSSEVFVGSEVEEDMNLAVLDSQYSFKIDANSPDQPLFDDNIVTQCLQDSYNEMHDPTQYRIDSIEVEETVVYKMDDTSDHNRKLDMNYTFFFAHIAWLFEPYCWGCDPQNDDPFGRRLEEKTGMLTGKGLRAANGAAGASLAAETFA
mmetsp:Transcript_22663/g.34243  ORF Transcript_22663/g.34243 Transcript_22663/m.34243 type:complete len:205 (-) Transcript_22663:165-779(-)|eukprot:CAMPEP_0178918254 /NCGR_PEP_ID=MMETSP0786-20121207/13728_1 /TAXON_ID=186022 /ORGANISM="Thalassionema frauenfeldii, Strain CCMP 1798" /LENGTH=204 /DNA_ID=CAMNT_0020591951 /DNA_START=107 /DNA_END=721 /DNA_ORIENTATION=+